MKPSTHRNNNASAENSIGSGCPASHKNPPSEEILVGSLPSLAHTHGAHAEEQLVAGRTHHDSETNGLSYSEILSVDCIDALRKLYGDKGFVFSANEAFIEKVKEDWGVETARVEKEAFSKEVPLRLEPTQVVVDRVEYSLFGVLHDFVGASSYRQMLSSALMGQHNKVVEGGITLIIPVQGAVEIPDSIVNSQLDTFIEWAKIGLTFPYVALKFYSQYFKPKVMEETNLKAANLPSDVWGELPAYVDIQLRERSNRRLTDVQERSAFQAEFLRAWRSGESKSFVVGMAHTAEVRYFLENGVRDKRIAEIAHRMAFLHEQDPREFYRQLALSQVKTVAAMIGGAHIGFLPYVGLMLSR